MAKVVGWAADNAGTGYYRIALPLLALRGIGHATFASNWFPKELLDKLKPDVIVGQRICKPGMVETWESLRATEDYKLVLDIDDDLFNIEPDNKAYETFGDPEIQRNLIRSLRAAHVVTVSTPRLAKRLERYAERVVVLPNRIDPALPSFGEQRLAAGPETASPGLVRIGWTGSPTHRGDVLEAATAISRFIADNPGKTEMAFVGADYSQHFKYPIGYRVHNYGWSRSLDKYFRRLAAAHFDIGIAPLKDNIFNRSKSALRALEYSALGIPIVASRVEPYRDFIRHRVDGLLVARTGEWNKYLKYLVEDSEARYALATAALEKAKQHTVDKHVKDWADVYGI